MSTIENKTFPAWSHSRLVVGETCPFRALLQYKRKIKEPDRPELEEGKEYPNERGIRVHNEAEEYVRGNIDLTVEISKHYEAEFIRLRELFIRGKVLLEDSWTFDDAWQVLEPLGKFPSYPWPQEFRENFNKIWLRIKPDALVFKSKKVGVAIDYKTGRRFGNEIKHAEQLQLYTLATFLRYEELEEITTEAWYLDINELATMTFTRRQGLRFLRSWNQRGINFTTMHDFRPRPHARSCMYCPYKTGPMGKSGVDGTGHCDRNPD